MNIERKEMVLNLCSFASEDHRGMARSLLIGNPLIETEEDIREAVTKINKIPKDRMNRLLAQELVSDFGLGKVIWWEKKETE